MGREAGGLYALLLAAALLALLAGSAWGTKYSTYVYDKDWVPPTPPAQKAELSCEFFSVSNTSCTLLGLMPESNREQILFALIRKGTPEENQDWARFWNSRLPITNYYENASDGQNGTNGSMRNAWMRVIDVYPSVFDPRDNYTYVPRQPYINTKSNAELVVNTDGNGICAQKYTINGYDVNFNWTVNNYTTGRPILPIDMILADGEKANLTFSLNAKADYLSEFWFFEKRLVCDQFNACEDKMVCDKYTPEVHNETVSLKYDLPIKRYPERLDYENKIMVPKRGYAQGIAKISIPSDFLSYELRVKGQTLRVQRNDLRYGSRGGIWPILRLELQPASAKQSSLEITYSNESDKNGIYTHELKYRLFVETPNVSSGDCTFILQTPFGTKKIERACETTVARPNITADYEPSGKSGATVRARVTDQLGQPIEGAEVVFSGAIPTSRLRTDASGNAVLNLQRRESIYTVVATVQGSGEISSAESIVYVPGVGAGNGLGLPSLPKIATDAAPILILIVIVSALLAVFMRRRSEWILFAALIVPLLLAGVANAQVGGALGSGLQATIDACKTYDFDNSVRHFGECAEAYRLQTEFTTMRATVSTLISNIAPLVVANPDITPYKEAYGSMSKIALSLFRVAWAFNSLYLILNVFNPTKRSAAIKQYVWLIVFVIFIYGSYFLLEDALTMVNVLSSYVAGPTAAQTLMQSQMSVEFISENYEMLKLVLPFLNMTYLVLLARYILVIGTLLFFPFTLLLYFTSATRGFGQAAITVTFATIGLGILNATLMLIYEILSRSADPLLSSTFSTTFFSASFLIFFGFVNALALAISFLSGIVFIGQNKLEAA